MITRHGSAEWIRAPFGEARRRIKVRWPLLLAATAVGVIYSGCGDVGYGARTPPPSDLHVLRGALLDGLGPDRPRTTKLVCDWLHAKTAVSCFGVIVRERPTETGEAVAWARRANGRIAQSPGEPYVTDEGQSVRLASVIGIGTAEPTGIRLVVSLPCESNSRSQVSQTCPDDAHAGFWPASSVLPELPRA